AAAAEPCCRQALSGGGGWGRARRLPRAQRQRGRRLRHGRLHRRAPGKALRKVDSLVAADGIHARPRDKELRQTSGGRRVRHRHAVQRQRYDWNNQPHPPRPTGGSSPPRGRCKSSPRILTRRRR
uniref:Uncharacterized protein n=1 Tax=Triticum urartu TaxID=4572 RepID=A0A8R7U1H9_TRIUA